MKIPFQNLRDTNSPLMQQLKEAACRVIESGWYLRGKETEALEQELARTIGTKHSVAVSNGLDALRLIFRAYMEMGKLKEGDEVIVAANTYIATILPLTELGLKPILLDPDPKTMNLSPAEALKNLSDKTRAVVLVHLYGTPCYDKEAIAELRSRGILIIEDNAQAIGASASGINTGAMGDAAAFSFYPTKNIGALGDAGAVTTNDDKLASTIRALANYGSDRRYHNLYNGWNCRMDEIQAAMLRVKLNFLEEETRKRQRIAQIYDTLIKNPGIIKPTVFGDYRQVWHQYIIRTKERDRVRETLANQGIATDIHYATPPHLQPCYANLEHRPLPLTLQLANEVISLPIANITEAEAQFIAKALNDITF